MRGTGSRQVVDYVFIFPFCHLHAWIFTLMPISATMRELWQWGFCIYFDVVSRVSKMVWSHCPTQVSLLTCQVFCQNGWWEKLSMGLMKPMMTRALSPISLWIWGPCLPVETFQVTTVGSHSIGQQPKLDPKFHGFVFHEQFESWTTLQWHHCLVHCHMLMWHILILKVTLHTVQNGSKFVSSIDWILGSTKYR